MTPTPPEPTSAELIIIGCVIATPHGCLHALDMGLTPDDFPNPACQLLYTCAPHLPIQRNHGPAIGQLLVDRRITRAHNLTGIPRAHIHRVVHDTPVLFHPDHQIRILLEASRLAYQAAQLEQARRQLLDVA